MPYIGNTPADKFLTLAKQSFSTSATTSYTLDSAVSSTQDIALFINNVRQSPVDAYSVSGTSLTLTSATAGTDEMYCVYLGKTVGTVNPPNDSVGLNQLSATGTPSSSNYLRGDNSWASAGTTINNNADNRVITGSGTANTLEGEAKLTFDGSTLINTQDAGADSEIKASAGSYYTKLIANGSSGFSEINFSHDIRVKDGGDSNDERFRVNGDGTIDVNVGGGTVNTSYWTMKLRQTGNASATHYMMAFAKQNDSTVGSIQTDGSNTSYNTSSDYRLKENIVDLTGAIDRVKTLKPKRFNFKDNPSKTQDGFLAHEIITVPEAVNGTKDATETYTDDDGNEQTRILPQQLDQSKLVPLLTSALQEAITKIETLETKVTALENA